MDRALEVQRGVRLEWLTIGYNCLEAAIALAAGIVAGSVALVGFGFDSVIEVTSGVALVWRLRADSERAERAALRVVGICFLVLAACVSFEAAESLLLREAPRRTLPGIALAVASMLVMPLLSRAKRRVAARIGSAALTADSRQTQLCAYLSVILLVGLAMNAVLGWWWADPLAALAMVPIIAKEGFDAVRGKTCCASCHPKIL
jgi:divalent metal cation (Fe/Co/Zn/Cd) transporter